MTQNIISNTGEIKLTWNDGVCTLLIDQPEKNVNSLTLAFLADFKEIITKVLADKSLKGLVIASGKKSCFCAGADIGIFEAWKNETEASTGSRNLQLIFDLLEEAKVPVVAAIHGACLGGGTEMALACHFRLCSTDSKTKISLPETKLGLLPGGGGTQRLPKLVGLINTLDLILTGKQLDAKRAAKMGLVDEAVPSNQLIERAIALCTNPELRNTVLARRQKFGFLKTNAIMRAFVNWQSKKGIFATTQGHYPAAYKALEAIMASYSLPRTPAFELEAKLFGECFATAAHASLVHIFRISTAAKKNPYPEDVQRQAEERWMKPLESGDVPVGILGAGLMGSGIATVLAEKKMRSIMLDNSKEGLAKGGERIDEHFMGLVKKRRITKRERDLAVCRVAPTLALKTLANTNFVVEAVFEDLNIKHQMAAKCEAEIHHDFIFATNTSSLPIADIAKGTRKPELVVGMHFFSPVPKMPLVEIIRTNQTRPDVVAATFDMATAMGKNVIIVNDGPGFFTTRVLAFLLGEAIALVSEGTPIENIDKAMKKFGWPVGPIQLVDEVGIDVGLHVMETMQHAFPERMLTSDGLAEFPKKKILGRKNGHGFYRYINDKREGINEEVYGILRKQGASRIASEEEIMERCNHVFATESIRCLTDGILQSSDDGDLGAIFGLGFPPFLGGPFHYVRTFGKDKFADRAKELAKQFGPRFHIEKMPESL
jgi:3-hydroxyacyl-CoA dehydrogenase/enoyl-CoA hydratase/3-hydroxybutyryl-CoA epimerase